MHNTHKPRIGQFISIDAPNLSLCFSLQSQPIPHKHTLQLHWPLHTQSPKRSITKSNCSVPTLQNPLQEIFIPLPWQSPTVIDHHKTTHDHVFWRLDLSFNFLPSKDNSAHFFAQIRIATFWTITVCCYLRICVHVHAARFGDVGNSFPGFAWVLLRCKAKQKSNEHWCATKYNSKNMCPLKCPDWKPMPVLQNVTTKSNICTILQHLLSNEKNLNFVGLLLRLAGSVTSLVSR